MSLIEDVEMLKKKLGEGGENLIRTEEEKLKKKRFKLPSKIERGARRLVRQGGCVVALLGNNKTLTYHRGIIKSGLVCVDDRSWAFDPSSVYIYKKTPIIHVIDYSLAPVGGKLHEYRSLVVGGKDDEEAALETKITSYAQQTIIRDIQNSVQEEQKKKGLKAGNAILYFIGGIIVVAIIANAMFGGG